MIDTKIERVDRNGKRYFVALMPSSTPGKDYRVDVTNGRCDCPAWKFSRSVNGHRRPCKHLIALGFEDLIQGSVEVPKPQAAPKEPKAPVFYPKEVLAQL